MSAALGSLLVVESLAADDVTLGVGLPELIGTEITRLSSLRAVEGLLAWVDTAPAVGSAVSADESGLG